MRVHLLTLMRKSQVESKVSGDVPGAITAVVGVITAGRCSLILSLALLALGGVWDTTLAIRDRMN